MTEAYLARHPRRHKRRLPPMRFFSIGTPDRFQSESLIVLGWTQRFFSSESAVGADGGRAARGTARNAGRLLDGAERREWGPPLSGPRAGEPADRGAPSRPSGPSSAGPHPAAHLPAGDPAAQHAVLAVEQLVSNRGEEVEVAQQIGNVPKAASVRAPAERS